MPKSAISHFFETFFFQSHLIATGIVMGRTNVPLSNFSTKLLMHRVCTQSVAYSISMAAVADIVDPADQVAFLAWDPQPLSLKVDAFKQYKTDNPDLDITGAYVKTMFLPKQVSGLWQLLKGKIKAQPKDVQDGWSSVCGAKVRSGKDKAKNEIMTSALFCVDTVAGTDANPECRPRWI